MKKQLLISVLAVLLFSCSSPLDKKFNEETAQEDIKAIKSEIGSTELNLLAGSMIRLEFQGRNLEEMTYAEILEDGKKWKAEQEKIEAEQKALAEKGAKKEAERIKKLRKAVIVSCVEKDYTEVDYQDYIIYKFVIQNKSDKAIRAVKGRITFTNLFDDEIKSLNFVYDQPIPAGKEVNWNATSDYNQFMGEDKALKNKDLKDLKVIWKPEKIIFKDGTTLE
jgi:hypothetical protein